MGCPTVILPGYLAGAADYEPLAAQLRRAGYPTWVVPLRATDWLITVGGRPMTPILQALAQTVAAAYAAAGGERIHLVGHSAGGWLGRLFLGSVPYREQVYGGRSQVQTLVSLGTPQVSGERWTRANLGFVNTHYPGAFWPDVHYVCVAGKAVQGRRTPWLQPWQWQGQTWLAYSSYQLTLGQGETWGDGITPIGAAHLAGGTNLVIDGVYHSPRQPLWYGSAAVVDHWLRYLP